MTDTVASYKARLEQQNQRVLKREMDPVTKAHLEEKQRQVDEFLQRKEEEARQKQEAEQGEKAQEAIEEKDDMEQGI